MEFRLLGPLEVVHDGRTVALGGTREREVMALLLLAPNRVVSADRLVEDLWSGRPPAGAVRALRVFVSRLRRALRDAGAGEILHTRTPGYVAQVDPAAIDVVRFEAGVAQGRAAAARGEHSTAADLLAGALGLWRGPALVDVASAPVARAEAARLEEVRLSALEERIDADLACGRHGGLVAELESLTRAHPLHERLWSARMLALYRCGRQAEALRAYGEVRDVLAEELGLDPGAALAHLEGAILRHDAGLDWPGAAGELASRPGAARPAAAAAAPRGNEPPPDAPLTILVTNVAEATALRTRLGEAEAARLFAAHEDVVRAQVAAHRGRAVKVLADGVVVAFTSARRAVACAVAVRRALAGAPGRAPATGVRIGLNTGEVHADGDDLYGPAVHAAAQIATCGPPGAILVSDLVRQLVATASGLEFADLGRHRLRGFPDEWPLYEVIAGDSTLVRFAERTPYVGRENERDLLRRLLAGAVAGHGALATIAGEAGVGKTRLTEELAAEAGRRGVRVRVGRCYESEGAPPYVPFVEMLEQALDASPTAQAFLDLVGEHAPEVARLLPRLRRMFPDLPPPLELPAEQERRHLFNSVLAVLERATATAPVVLVLDDLHWADEPTLLLLEHLAERLPELPVLAVATFRDNEVDARPALARTLDRLIRRGLLSRISLRRMSEADVRALLTALSGRTAGPPLGKLIHAQTDGNPFFVEEIFKHLAEEGRLFDADGEFRAGITGELGVSESLRLVLGRRLEHLAPGTRRALESAAVVGRAFTFELLSEMGDIPSDDLLDALEAAERARLIAPLSADATESRLLFAHELIRQTILTALPTLRRRRLHLRAADALERSAGEAAAELASQIADHLSRAGAGVDTARLATCLTAAGRHAMSTAGFEEALRHFEHAVRLRDAVSPARGAEMLVDLALARRSLGRLQEAYEAWLAAIDALEALGDSEAMARACSAAANDLLWANRDQEGFDLARRGLAALGDAPTPQRARMLGWVAGAGGWIAPYDVVDGMSREAVALATTLGDDRLLGEALLNDAALRMAFYQQERNAASGGRGGALLSASGDLWNMAQSRAWQSVALTETGRWAASAQLRDEVGPVAQRLGHFAALFLLDWAGSPIPLAVDPDVARFGAEARDASARFEGLNFESVLLARLGLAGFLCGDWDAAADLAAQATEYELPNRLHGMAWGQLLQTHAYRGERAAALAVLERERGTLPVPGVPNAYGSWQFLGYCAEGLSVLGERDECAALYPAAREFASSGVVLTVFQGRLTERVAAMTAAAAADWAAAEGHFAAAMRQAHDLPHRLEAAETRRFHAAMLLDRAGPGDRARARDLLAEAGLAYAGFGMPRHVELARVLAGAC